MENQSYWQIIARQVSGSCQTGRIEYLSPKIIDNKNDSWPIV